MSAWGPMYQGGPFYSYVQPEIAIGFWGTATATWGTGAGSNSPTYTQIVAQMQALVNSPYFAKLNQYNKGSASGIGLPRLAPFSPIFVGKTTLGNLPATASFTDYELIAQSFFANGTWPTPHNVNMDGSSFEGAWNDAQRQEVPCTIVLCTTCMSVEERGLSVRR
jgi:hypothetical protein